jgi:hypothetical protein
MIEIAICIAALIAPARFDDVDPVMKAKTQRTLGDSQDLPPIPRGLTQPPPLPPPELHTHDIRKQRRSLVASKKRSAAKTQAAKGKAAPPKPGSKASGGQKPIAVKNASASAAKPKAQPAKKPTTAKG